MPSNLITAILGAGGLGGVALTLRHVRLHLRDRSRSKFARHVFDQTRSTEPFDKMLDSD